VKPLVSFVATSFVVFVSFVAISFVVFVAPSIVPVVAAAQVPVRDTQAQTQAVGTGVIRGRVVRLDNGEPLRGVSIVLTGTGLSGPVRNLPSATTDERGRYELTGLPAARYTLTATKGTFVTLQYGQLRANQPGRPIDVAEGQVLEQMDLALPRGGAIAGRVVDELGEPVTGAVVQLLRQRYVKGRRQLDSGGRSFDHTDDRGQFRIYGVPPGTYYLSASVPRMPVPDAFRGPGGVGSATSFYPGTASSAEAQPVTLALAQEVTGLSFMFVPGHIGSISGTVTTSDGQPAPTANLSVAQRIPFTSGGMTSAGVGIRPDGSYAIPNLPPGPYTLSVRFLRGGDESALSHVVLDGSDLVVPLVTGPGATARGRFVFEGGKPPAGPRSSLGVISMSSVDPDEVQLISRSPVIRDDWTFEVGGLRGRLRLGINPPEGWAVKSIRIGDADVTDVALDFSAGDVAGIDVLLTSRISEVSGIARDGQGRSVTDATVVLLADDPAKWMPDSRHVAVIRPDQRGQFSHRGLPPGRYVAVALDYLEPGEETNPDMLKRLQAVGGSFTLAEGEARTLEVTLSILP
jgi:hypothetical protein